MKPLKLIGFGTQNIGRRSKVFRSYVILVLFHFLIGCVTPEKIGRLSGVDDFRSTTTKLASGQDAIITHGSSESSPSSLPEPRRGSNKNNKKAKKPSSIKSYQNRGDFGNSEATSSSSKEFLTQLFTKWMSFGPTEMTASSSSAYMAKSFTGHQQNYRVMDWLSSTVKEWWSESSTGRTFLLAPLLTAIPMMAVEILAIGSLGVFAPAFIILSIVLLPLLLVGFIIFI